MNAARKRLPGDVWRDVARKRKSVTIASLASRRNLLTEERRTGLFFALLEENGMPLPSTQKCLIPGRKFRSDYVWEDFRVTLECHGVRNGGDGHWKGRHTSIRGFSGDIEKQNLLQILGWRTLVVLGHELATAKTIEMLKFFLNEKHD